MQTDPYTKEITVATLSHETYESKVADLQRNILELGSLVFNADAVEEEFDGPNDPLLSDDLTLEEADTILGELGDAWKALQTGTTAKSSETDLTDHLLALREGTTDIDVIVMAD